MARSQLIDRLEKNGRELAQKSTHFVNQTYLASLGAVEYAREQGSEFLGELVSRGEKVEAQSKEFIRQRLEGRRDAIDALRRDALRQVEEALERLRVSVQGRFDGLASAVAALENRLRKLEKEVSGFPIENYDELTAKDIITKLDGLDREALEQVRAYEADNKHRVTVLNAIAERLEATAKAEDHAAATVEEESTTAS